jgi:hypothetical protein
MTTGTFFVGAYSLEEVCLLRRIISADQSIAREQPTDTRAAELDSMRTNGGSFGEGPSSPRESNGAGRGGLTEMTEVTEEVQ